MASIKINGRNCREVADEISKIVGRSAHYNLYGNCLQFEMCDAEEIAKTAEDAAKYLKSTGKRAKAVAADTVRSAVREVIISESYAMSFAS